MTLNMTLKHKKSGTVPTALYLIRKRGEPRRTRTYNPLIKSQLLYH
jgi:hypothetical protein